MRSLFFPIASILAVLAATPLAAQDDRSSPATAAVSADTGRASPSASADAAQPRPRGLVRGSRGRAYRLEVSLDERRLWWMDGADTLYTAPVAIGKGTRLAYGARAWSFTTPRGERRVLSKEPNPVWTPPDWHYVELARDSGWTLVRLERGKAANLGDGTRLEVRGERIGRVLRDGHWEPVPPDEEVIYGDTLFIPPLGTANRRVEGELGAFKLDLGDGYMIHGTPHQDSIGQAATHGCIRLRDEDIAYLYHTVPVGTPVVIR